MEIYNEKLKDLLNLKNKIKIRNSGHDEENGDKIENLTEIEVNNY